MMNALQDIITVMLTQDVTTQMGVLRAAVILGTLVMESAVKVNTSYYLFCYEVRKQILLK